MSRAEKLDQRWATELCRISVGRDGWLSLDWCATAARGSHSGVQFFPLRIFMNIPKVAHFVWLGGAPPANAVHNIVSFKADNPGYRVTLTVTNSQRVSSDLEARGVSRKFIEAINIQSVENVLADWGCKRRKEMAGAIIRESNGSLRNLAAASDLVRLVLLEMDPGIYMDVDVHHSGGMPQLTGEFLVHKQPSLNFQRQFELNNNVMASSPAGRSIVNSLIDRALDIYGAKKAADELIARDNIQYFMSKNCPSGEGGRCPMSATELSEAMWRDKRVLGSEDRMNVTLSATGPYLATSKIWEISGAAEGGPAKKSRYSDYVISGDVEFRTKDLFPGPGMPMQLVRAVDVGASWVGGKHTNLQAVPQCEDDICVAPGRMTTRETREKLPGRLSPPNWKQVDLEFSRKCDALLADFLENLIERAEGSSLVNDLQKLERTRRSVMFSVVPDHEAAANNSALGRMLMPRSVALSILSEGKALAHMRVLESLIRAHNEKNPIFGRIHLTAADVAARAALQPRWGAAQQDVLNEINAIAAALINAEAPQHDAATEAFGDDEMAELLDILTDSFSAGKDLQLPQYEAGQAIDHERLCGHALRELAARAELEEADVELLASALSIFRKSVSTGIGPARLP